MTLWHHAAMPPDEKNKEKMSRFDKVALEIAEGIANIPIEAEDALTELLKELENTAAAPKAKKHLSAKIRDEMKKIRKARSKSRRKPSA
jgi:lipoate-protein ligase A